jgi:hypothetical protein
MSEEKPLMNKLERWICIIAFFALAFFIANNLTNNKDASPNYVETKVDSVKSIPPIKPSVTNNYPTKIIYQTIIDTSRRKEAEKETIITGVKIDKGEVTIQKIDSVGHVTSETHKVEEGSKVLIDNKNFEEKKRTRAGKFLKKAGKVVVKGLAVVGAVAIMV